MRFYNILLEYEIQVEVVGKKWAVLFPTYMRKCLECAEEGIMNIYAEGNGMFTDQGDYVKSWLFVKSIGRMNHIWISERYRNKYLEKGIKILTVHFPMIIPDMTLEEEYRQQNHICLGLVNSDFWSNKNGLEMLFKVCGRRITYMDWNAALNRKKSEYIYLNCNDLN